MLRQGWNEQQLLYLGVYSSVKVRVEREREREREREMCKIAETVICIFLKKSPIQLKLASIKYKGDCRWKGYRKSSSVPKYTV